MQRCTTASQSVFSTQRSDEYFVHVILQFDMFLRVLLSFAVLIFAEKKLAFLSFVFPLFLNLHGSMIHKIGIDGLG